MVFRLSTNKLNCHLENIKTVTKHRQSILEDSKVLKAHKADRQEAET